MADELRTILDEAAHAIEADRRSISASRRMHLARQLRALGERIGDVPPPDAWERLRAVMSRVVVTDEMIGATLLMGRTQESLEGYIAAVRELVRIAVAVERDRAEGEAAALREALADIESMCRSLLDQTDIIDPDWVVQRAAQACQQTEAGKLFLAELEAGRTLADRLIAQLALIGICPICSARMDPLVSVFKHANGCQLEIYEAARKAKG